MTSSQVTLTDAGPRASAAGWPSASEGEVVVATRAAAIVPSDLESRAGLVMGGAFSGEVIDAGPGVERDLIGAHVAVLGYRACGACPRCGDGKPSACSQLGLRGRTIDGGLADAVVLRADEVLRLPGGLSPADAVFMHWIACAIHATRRGAGRPGDNVAVLGSSPVGLAMSALALATGFGRVAVLEEHAECRSALAAAGVRALETPADDTGWDELRTWLGGFGPDVVFECEGAPASRLAAVELTRPAGSVVLLADDERPVPMDFNLLVMGDKRVQGSRIYTSGEAGAALELLARERIDISPLVGTTVSIGAFLNQAAEGSLAGGLSGCRATVVTWPKGATLPEAATV